MWLPVAVDHYVCRLQIAMNHTLFMCMMQGVGNFDAQLGRLAASRLLAGKPISESHTADEVTNDVDTLAIAADFVDAHNVWMAKLSGGTGFAEEFFLVVTRHADGTWDFNGDSAIELPISGLPNTSKTADPDPLDEFKSTHPRQGRRNPRVLSDIDETELTSARAADEIGEPGVHGDLRRRVAIGATDNEVAGASVGITQRSCDAVRVGA
jgi:hypothetical protein